MAGSEDVGARRSIGPPPPLPGILASLTRLGIFRQAAMQRDHQVAGVADIIWSFYKGRVLVRGGGVLCGGGVTGADVASKACEESKGRGADSFCVCLSHRGGDVLKGRHPISS